jgi:hypothetical protein
MPWCLDANINTDKEINYGAPSLIKNSQLDKASLDENLFGEFRPEWEQRGQSENGEG